MGLGASSLHHRHLLNPRHPLPWHGLRRRLRLRDGLAGLTLAALAIPEVMGYTRISQTPVVTGLYTLLVPAVAWLFWSGDTVWGIALAIWTVFVGSFDNFLRPWLIKKGANLPLLLIFVGVIGGLIAFGLVGIFIGPVVLAITYTLLGAWMAEAPPATDGPIEPR
jgi:MFS superfamily sulfate permease-like transporter